MIEFFIITRLISSVFHILSERLVNIIIVKQMTIKQSV